MLQMLQLEVYDGLWPFSGLFLLKKTVTNYCFSVSSELANYEKNVNRAIHKYNAYR